MSGRRGPGRPRKQRPALGSEIKAGMSHRDIASALGISRQGFERWLMMATLPKEDFEAYLADCNEKGKIPSSREVELLARRHAGKSTERERRCPHCGY